MQVSESEFLVKLPVLGRNDSNIKFCGSIEKGERELGFGLDLGVGEGGALVPRMADSSDGGARVLEKPSRSEEQLDLSAEEQENRTEAVRQKLEALLPKRPLKPARSEAQQLAAAVQESETPPSLHSPEFLRFQGLQDSASVKLPVDGSSVIVVEEEYVETKYYNDFAASEEKLHHTTGTGFIPLDPPETPPFHLSSEDQQESAAGEAAAIHQKRRGGNPATNEWEPNPQTASFPPVSSSKAARSESV